MESQISGEALEKLLEHHAKFLAFLQHRVESKEAAEDILQSAFVRGMVKGSELRENESAIAWFYRMLRNAVIDHYRHSAVASRAMERWARELETEMKPDELIQDVACDCVKDVLGELKPEYRDAIQLVDIEERSMRELSEVAGISENNAAVRVHRARQALRKEVKLTCGVCAEHGCVDCRCRR